MPLEPLQADVLGPDYRVETFSLPPDDEGPVVATLVTLGRTRPNGRAVLHVHGFADYFFHDEYARWWADRGYDFYAIDLRKYGRSLREHQTPHYVSDLAEYFAEIDLAWWRITERDGFTDVVASGALHRRADAAAVGRRAATRRAAGAGAELAVVRHAGSRLAAQPGRAGGARAARHATPHAADPAQGQRRLRPHPAPRARRRVGLRPRLEAAGVLPGLRRLAARGPARPRAAARRPRRAPARRWCSPRPAPAFGEQTDETATTHDIVLDVQQIRRWASSVGRHVTSVAVEGAIHDIVLSRPEVRRDGVRRARPLAARVGGAGPVIGGRVARERQRGNVRRAGPPGR